jgi:hypothetical protein
MQSDNIHFSQRKVTTVAPQDTTEIQLRLIDWHRIYRKINSISPAFSGRELIAGVSWGVTSSSLLSLVPLYQSAQTVDPWVKPTFLIVAITSGIIGFVIWRGAKDYTKDVAAAKADLIIDMQELHYLYFPSENLNEK